MKIAHSVLLKVLGAFQTTTFLRGEHRRHVSDRSLDSEEGVCSEGGGAGGNEVQMRGFASRGVLLPHHARDRGALASVRGGREERSRRASYPIATLGDILFVPES